MYKEKQKKYTNVPQRSPLFSHWALPVENKQNLIITPKKTQPPNQK